MGSSPSLPHGALVLVKILCVSTWPSAWQLVLLAQHLVIVTVTISPSPMHTHIRFAPALNTWAQGGVKRSLGSLGTLRFCNNDAPPNRCVQVHMHVCLATQSNTHTHAHACVHVNKSTCTQKRNLPLAHSLTHARHHSAHVHFIIPFSYPLHIYTQLHTPECPGEGLGISRDGVRFGFLGPRLDLLRWGLREKINLSQLTAGRPVPLISGAGGWGG